MKEPTGGVKMVDEVNVARGVASAGRKTGYSDQRSEDVVWTGAVV